MTIRHARDEDQDHGHRQGDDTDPTTRPPTDDASPYRARTEYLFRRFGVPTQRRCATHRHP